LLRQSEEDAAGGSHCSILRRTIEEWLADFGFEPANGLADGGLRPVQSLSRAGKALFLRDGDQHFELVYVH
jgi:hypothetical protein